MLHAAGSWSGPAPPRDMRSVMKMCLANLGHTLTQPCTQGGTAAALVTQQQEWLTAGTRRTAQALRTLRCAARSQPHSWAGQTHRHCCCHTAAAKPNTTAAAHHQAHVQATACTMRTPQAHAVPRRTQPATHLEQSCDATGLEGHTLVEGAKHGGGALHRHSSSRVSALLPHPHARRPAVPPHPYRRT